MKLELLTMYGDATNWDENAYRETVLKEREIQTRTVFRTAWAPPYNLDTLLVASSDGSVASYSISSSIAASKLKNVSIISIAFFFVILFDSSAYQTDFAWLQLSFTSTARDFTYLTTKLTVLISWFCVCCSLLVLLMRIQISMYESIIYLSVLGITVFRVRCYWFRLSVEPNCFIQAHCGPAYDVKFYGDGEDALLLRFKFLLNSDLFCFSTRTVFSWCTVLG